MRISCIKEGDILRITAIDGTLPDGPCELITADTAGTNANPLDALFPTDDASWSETLDSLTRKNPQ